MGTYYISYDEVNAETRRLMNHLRSNIIEPTNTEYRQIRNNLRQADGAANAAYSDAMDINREKTLEATRILERLLGFISDSSRRIQSAENNIARSFSIIRR